MQVTVQQPLRNTGCLERNIRILRILHVGSPVREKTPGERQQKHFSKFQRAPPLAAAGPSLTIREKAPIKDLYREFKDLERRLAINSEGGAVEDGATMGTDVSLDIESVKEDKKRVKREIQAWLDEFEVREGRAALQE